MFWRSRIEKILAGEVEWLRARIDALQQRNDRLVEALAQKDHTPLFMPQTPTVNSNPQPPSPLSTEKSSGWFDTRPIPAVKPNTGGTPQ